MNAVATHIEFGGLRFPRDPADIARDQWIAEQLPVRVAALAATDKALVRAFGGVIASPAMLDAYRGGDDAELGRRMRAAVESELANAAELDLDEDAYERFPEQVFPPIAPPKVDVEADFEARR